MTMSPPSVHFQIHEETVELADQLIARHRRDTEPFDAKTFDNAPFDEDDLPPHYRSPKLEVLSTPHQHTTFDGFTVDGLVSGSAVDNAVVAVSIGDITRTGRSMDGLWSVRFEDGCLSRRHAGVSSMTVRVTDQYYQSAQISEPITLDEFVDGYVHIDAEHQVEHRAGQDLLVARGELGLGSHIDGRELVIVLVRDDNEGIVVATGIVSPGWQYGEWEARIALNGIDSGAYRVRALLVDNACATLTRVATGGPITLP